MTADSTLGNGTQSTDMVFQLLKKGVAGSAARVGRLALPNRRPIDTPNFVASTSRGAVPHVTPDNLAKHTTFGGAYMALEDFFEKKEPPILRFPSQSRPLHDFTCFPADMATIMGPRRTQAVTTPTGNGTNFISIWTSTGYTTITIDAYASAIEKLRPDIAIAPADLFHTSKSPPSKKLIRMAERTEEWSIQFLTPQRQARFRERGIAIFAPVLAVPYHIQWEYLNHLVDSHQGTDALAGLAIQDIALLPDLIENYTPLEPLARLSLDAPATPHMILRQISAGVDICTVPFLNAVSDAGVALTFTFPPPMQEPGQPALALGSDMWTPDHVTAIEPLREGCQCYVCTKHHRAFIHHLLNTKEMLGWALLQIHNHQVLSDFFSGIRAALAEEGRFEELAARFSDVYEAELPAGTGSRPRARGYHLKSGPAQEKINEAPWENYNKGDGPTVGAAAAADGIETPLVPDEDSRTLDSKGFAEKTGP
ncbi:tRNA-guanine transglycosylase [Plectosphaerella plurivora]|uniref:Queuine tRNA-ribosyltransferase accessory subunit 2 n=1 Tax=Plectosphaerella plurivora TaxID=936078 RepID=A0A9P8VAT5_9PEZI|nr:tRNA-guanine transglycosylase [Plectosphaerella plurivora]